MARNEAKRPGLRARLGAWIAGKGVVTTTSDVGWNAIGGDWGFGPGPGRFTGSCVNWERRAGVLWGNPAAALATSFLFDKVVLPQLVLQRPVQGGVAETLTPQEMTPALTLLMRLLDQPNPEHDGITLRQILTLSYKFAGNAYLIKVRASRYSPPTELWYVPHWQMKPVPPDDGGPTREYERSVPAGNGRVTKERYAREDVIHFRRGIDPANPRMGMNLFAAILRELVTDSDIATFTAALLRNFGVTPGIVGSADAEDALTPDERDRLKEMLDSRTTGDQAGSWVVSSLPLKVDKIGSSPADMDIARIGVRPEARVLAAFGLNAMAIGLPSDDKKYANLKESRAAAWEDGILPMLEDFAATMSAQLLPEFDPGGDLRLAFSYAGIVDLQADVDKTSARLLAEWQRGARRLWEVRAALALPEDAETPDGYYWQLAGKAPGAPAQNPADSAGPQEILP